MVLHMYKDSTENLNLKTIANDFCTRTDICRQKFSTFENNRCNFAIVVSTKNLLSDPKVDNFSYKEWNITGHN